MGGPGELFWGRIYAPGFTCRGKRAEAERRLRNVSGVGGRQLRQPLPLQTPPPSLSAPFSSPSPSFSPQVCVTLYWLGRLVVEKTEYKGPQLDFGAFGTLLHNQAVNEAVKYTLPNYFVVILLLFLLFLSRAQMHPPA